MDMKEKIHFRNEPFMARVSDKGEEPIKCTPVVYDEMLSCGVGIFYEDGKGQAWGMMTPRNLIAAWRATEILRHFDSIEHSSLSSAYHTGLRDPHKNDVESYVNPTIEKIGREAYDTIMSMPVPEEIIRAVLDNQQDDFPPALWPITQEVRVGTIQWRQEFADAGIKHPAEVDAKEREQEATIAAFESLLASYSKATNLPRKCMGMNHLEGALLTLVEKNMGQAHSDEVVIALAGAVGRIASFEFAMSLMPSLGPRTQEEYGLQIETEKQGAIFSSAEWLITVSSGFSWRSWRRRKGSLTLNDAKQLLGRLLVEYFPPKQHTEESATA